jgi:hypothetical protein
MRRGIRTRISQLMYRCLAHYLVNSALCVDIQLWSRHVASRPPEIPTERSGYSIGTVCGLAPQPEAVSTSSIHLSIYSTVHSLPPYLHRLDYIPSIEIGIHIYSVQLPVKRAFHLILSFVSDPTTPDSAHPHHLSSTPPSPSIIKYIVTLEHIPRTPNDGKLFLRPLFQTKRKRSSPRLRP